MSCTLKDIQNKEYEILKELDRICEKHGIKYYLAQGTLIGAARHKGFIPWDDDIDVILYHKDLKKLIEIYDSEADEKYILTNYKREKHFPLTWTKIREKNTLSRPKTYKDIPINWGICIDLFQVYPISNNKFFRKAEIFFFKFARKMLMAEMTKYEKNHNFIIRFLEKIPISLRHFVLNLSLKIFSLHNDNTEYVYMMCKEGRLIKRECIFGEEKKLQFENSEFPVPSDYHTFLTEGYGDYMTMPPESEQGGHDLRMGDIEWSCDVIGDNIIV